MIKIFNFTFVIFVAAGVYAGDKPKDAAYIDGAHQFQVFFPVVVA